MMERRDNMTDLEITKSIKKLPIMDIVRKIFVRLNLYMVIKMVK